METDINVVIDRSGSMAPLTADTIGGFNVWLDKMQEAARETTDKAFISVTVFGSQIRQTIEHIPIEDCPKLGTPLNPYEIEGMTALLEAVGTTLMKAKHRVGVKGLETGNPVTRRGLAVIITDGYENASKGWTTQRLAGLMGELEKTDLWSFLYMGAGIDSWGQASTFDHSGLQTRSTSYDPLRTAAAFASAGAVNANYLRSASLVDQTLGSQVTAEMEQEEKTPTATK